MYICLSQNLINESTPKSHSTPTPIAIGALKGELFNTLIFNVSPFRVGVKNIEYQYFTLFGVDSNHSPVLIHKNLF